MSINQQDRFVVDVGNTSIACAAIKSGDVISPNRIETSSIVSIEDVSSLFENLRVRSGVDSEIIVVCAGVERIRSLIEQYREINSKKVDFISGRNLCGAKVSYETIETLGPDRIANTLAASNLFSTPTLVVDCGTAITIDLVDADGVFVGGMIAPGLETSKNALVHFAPSLPEVNISVATNIVATNTISCIQSGIVNGAAAMIDGVANKLSKINTDLVVVITGGHSSILFPLLEHKAIHDEWLTLKGLGFAKTA